MSTQARDQQKAPSDAAATPQSSQFELRPFKTSVNSAFAPATNQFQYRSFATPAQQAPPDIQAQLERAKRFNYDLSEINLFATGTTPPEPPSPSSNPVMATGRGWIQPKCEACEAEEKEETSAVQTKLTIGQPGDRYEREADAVAAKVVEQINSPASQQPVQSKVEPVAQPTVMRDSGVGGGAVDSSVEQNIQQAKGGGQGLSEEIKVPMEQAFGADFSRVKVHTDGNANQLNRSLHSRAFTTGEDIFFKQGEYQPGTKGGQELLAHELTHVVQQNGQHLQSKPVSSDREQVPKSEQQLEDAQSHGVLGFGDSLLLWRMVQTKLDLGSQTKDNELNSQSAAELNQQQSAESLAPSHSLASTSNQPSIQAKCSECEKEEEEEIQRQTISSTPSGEETVQALGWDDISNAASAGADWVGDQASDAADWAGDRIEDVTEMGADAFASIVEQVSPNLAELIRNGPEALLNETLEGGIQSWLQGILGDIDIGSAITGLQTSLGTVFSTLQGVINGDKASCDAFAQGINSLKELAQSFMDNPAVQAIQEAFTTVGNAFQTVTDFVVAPVFDTLMEVAGGVFNQVQALASTIWEWGGAVRDYLSDAWDWVMEQLGIGGNGEGGILDWIKEQASAVWNQIKETFAPVIGPLRTVLTVIVAFSPAGPFLAAITYGPQIVEAVQWLWNNKDNPNIVQAAHEEMGNTILPQLLSGAQGFSQTLQSAATTFISQAVQMSEGVLQLLGAISGVPLLSVAQTMVQTVSTTIQNFATWCQESFQGAVDAVQSLFTTIQEVVAPYAEILSSLALAVVNPGMIPVILAGWAWRAIPKCYKLPIINFLLDAIIGILQALPNLPMMGPLWPMLKTGVIGFLEGVKGQDDNEKIAITNKLAKIISGASPAFLFGFVKGLLQGIWEGITDPFVLIYTVMEGLGNLVQWLNNTVDSALGGDAESASSTPSPEAESLGTGEPQVAQASPEPTASGAMPPIEQQAISSRMQEMGSELQPPVEQVTGGFMPAVEEAFSGGEGMSYEQLAQKLGEAWEAVQTAIRGAGQDLANRVCEFLLQDSAEGEMGEAVGWLAGTIIFEVVLGILTAATYQPVSAASKLLKTFAKVLDWTGEAMGAAFKALAKLGGYLLDAVKGLGKLLSNAGGAARVVMEALQEIGEKVMRFADELLGRVGRGAAGEATEAAAERTARETAEAGVERTASEVAEAGSERAAQEAAEAGAERTARETAEAGGERTSREAAETGGERTSREGVEETGEEAGERSSRDALDDAAERQQALLAAKGIARVNEEAGMPPHLLINQLMPLAQRYRSVNSFHAIPISAGHARIIMRTEDSVDTDYQFAQQLQDQVTADANELIENLSDRQRNKRAATSRAGTPEHGMTDHFENLSPGPGVNTHEFPGFDSTLQHSHFKMTVSSPDEVMDAIRARYTDAGTELHPKLDEIISGVIREPGRTFSSRDGVPGLHAEVQAVNAHLHRLNEEGIEITDDVLANVYVATNRLTTYAPEGQVIGEAMPACTNCTSILDGVVKILTGSTH